MGSYGKLPPSDPPEPDSDSEDALVFPSSPTPASAPCQSMDTDEIVPTSEDTEVLLVDYMRELKSKQMAQSLSSNTNRVSSTNQQSSMSNVNEKSSTTNMKTSSTKSSNSEEPPLKNGCQGSNSRRSRARRLEETRLGPAASRRRLRSQTKKEGAHFEMFLFQNGRLKIQHIVLKPGDSILISYALPEGVTPRISLSEPADIQVIRIRLPHTAFDTAQDSTDPPPPTNEVCVPALVNVVSIEGSEGNDNPESPASPLVADHLASLMEYPSPFYTAYKRIPELDEINWIERWPRKYIVVGRGSRIGVFPDFDFFHQFVDMPGSMFTRVPDMDTARHMYQEYHSGSLPKVLLLTPNLDISAPLIDETDPDCDEDVHGDNLKRLMRIVEDTVPLSSQTLESYESDYGSDDFDWSDPNSVQALNEAEKKAMSQGCLQAAMASLDLLRVFNENLRLDLTGHVERQWLALELDTDEDISALVELHVEIRAEFRRKLLNSTVWQLRLPSHLVDHYKEVAYVQAMQIIKNRRMREHEEALEITGFVLKVRTQPRKTWKSTNPIEFYIN
ncbi:hypothetical protein BT96DRAFT_943357 [Gymnopus androsaceus JB14]|uniref:Uncharacterized protein n=1 Tax=Gymnopus androsaceus JB14 TaxID=1447944 RepID=A0A6A4H960_9AGAR|nr:hypothetical protein BT96DRAFT_943357 [Gymnopus androsaceus JB14]